MWTPIVDKKTSLATMFSKELIADNGLNSLALNLINVCMNLT